jgi:hypothetical protein
VGYPGIFAVSASDGADQQHGDAEIVVDVVQPSFYRAHEGRTVKKWEKYVEIIKVTVNEVSHKVNIRELELYGREFRYRRHPLQGSSAM